MEIADIYLQSTGTVASFPGPTQLSIACSNRKAEEGLE